MKKDETRFTIRFNPIDPRHQIAMDALKTSGRRKATLIADALCEYFSKRDIEGVAPIPITQLRPISNATINVPETSILETLDNTPFDNDMRDTILNGLSSFKF